MRSPVFTSLSHGFKTDPNRDNLISVSLGIPPTFSASRAEGNATQPIDNPHTALTIRFVSEKALTLDMPVIESQDRLWEVEEKCYKHAPFEVEERVSSVRSDIWYNGR